MIPKPFIAKWKENSPWREFYQIEQDLIISRILVEIFSNDFLKENLAFRGGTALHKLYLNPASRYSEDIDLVQIKPGPVKPILEHIEKVVTFFDEKRNTKIGLHGAKALYRFYSEYEQIKLRLKLEINCKEHFNVLDWEEIPFEVESNWFTGTSKIRTYNINELLGTKLRALFQRSKGRDLFDLYYSSLNYNLDHEKIIQCFTRYMKFSTGNVPSKKIFISNLEEKEKSLHFRGDMEAILRPGVDYDQKKAFNWIKRELIEKYYKGE